MMDACKQKEHRTDMENRPEAASDGVSQPNYHETPYSDQDWEVVGERSECRDFVPMEIETLQGERVCIDPMFPDYGGHYDSPETARPYYHPGENVRKKTPEEEDAEQGIIRIRRSDLDHAVAEAEERGRVEATEQLVEENERRMKLVEQNLLAVFQDYQAQLVETMAALEQRAVDLSVAISEKIIGYAVEINPEYIIPLVREALKMVGSAHVSRVRVSPQDMEFIEVLGVQKAVRDLSEFSFEPDESIRSGCVVETSAGQIDYQLDKAWERVRDSVVKAVS